MRNFLVTTGLVDTWELNENNFFLGKWCELYEIDKYIDNKIPDKVSIIKNNHHWLDNEKKISDNKYMSKIIEYLLEIVASKLSIIHNVNENKEYWRIIIYSWLKEYVILNFDRWEHVRIFFEKNKNEEFYSNFIALNNSDYIAKNHNQWVDITQTHEWNHLLFLKLFHFLKIQNLTLIEKKNKKNNLKKKIHKKKNNITLKFRIIIFIENIISKFGIRFNHTIFESFYFPKKEYFKICLRCKLIPCKYISFFDFEIKNNSLPKNDKRIELKDLLLKESDQDKFVHFLLFNLHESIPRSFLEDFETIKKKYLPFAKKRKIIFSMVSIWRNDNFKIYLAETKKVGSKYIHAAHGGGLPYFEKEKDLDLLAKISEKIISWDQSLKKNFSINLSPTLPSIKLVNSKVGNNCSILFVEQLKYIFKFPTSLLLDESIEFFDELTGFVNKLNPEIRSKVKFRVKENHGYNCEKKFSELFGEKYIDKVSFKNPFRKSILNSKLIIATYPQTAFCEAMYSNVPTILIIHKNHYLFTQEAMNVFNVLKKNKIAFEDFNEAKDHINKYWKNLDVWWKDPQVQSAREMFLKNFFNVKSNWFKEWSDYIYSSRKLLTNDPI